MHYLRVKHYFLLKQEKNKLGLEYESMKAEYNLKCQEASLKYSSFDQELQELRSR